MYKRKIFAEITKSELCYAVHNIAQNILYVYMYVRTHTHTHTLLKMSCFQPSQFNRGNTSMWQGVARFLMG